MTVALVVLAVWTLLALAVAPIVGRGIRDGGHGELSESRRTSGPAGRQIRNGEVPL